LQIDGRSVPEDLIVECGICIVGAGAAGISLGRALAEKHHDLIILESGGLTLDAPTQDLYRGEIAGADYPLQASRLRYFGGTTNHWTGWCRRLDPIDFRPKPWASVEGWPFGETELNPYYAQAERLCQLGGHDYDPNETASAGIPMPFPDPKWLKTTLFRLSPPTRFGQQYGQELLESEAARIFLHTNALEILADTQTHHVRGIRAGALSGNRFVVKAKHYVLACGGIENARILLTSRGAGSHGLGNERDLVGRYFCEHPHLVSGIFLPSDPELDMRLYTQFSANGQAFNGALVPAEDTIRAERMLNSSVTFSPVGRRDQDIVEAENSQGFESLRAVARALRQKEWPDRLASHIWNMLRDLDDVAIATYGRSKSAAAEGQMYKIFLRSESMPVPESRVRLSREVDACGVPRVELDWKLADVDVYTLRRMQELVAHEVGRAGLGRVFLPPDGPTRVWPEAISGGNHHMGTTRMAADPYQGVVDSDCRLHGCDNLWIAGSSVFPSVGYANPTLTIVALALRIADSIHEKLCDA